MAEYETIDISNKLKELHSIFYHKLPIKVSNIEALWQCFINNQSTGKVDDSLITMHRLIHSLVGSSGTYGAMSVNSVARELERTLLIVIEDSNKKLTTSEDTNLIVNKLIKHLTRVANDSLPADIPFIEPLEYEKQREKNLDNNNLIYLAEDDGLLEKKLVSEIQQAGYRVKCFSDLESFDGNCKKEPPAVVIMDVVFNDDYTAGIDFIKKVKENNGVCPPVIIISTRDDFDTRLAVSQAGAHRYFCKPLDIDKIIISLDNITNLNGNNPYRVLIVDDDEGLLKYYETILTGSGMVVKTLLNSLECLTVLSEFKPDILVLDVYIPKCSGPELANVIRLDDTWALMPIMFLSTETNIERQLDAMSYGGDDFLVKPINPANLISAVRVRAKRARLTSRLNNDLKNALRESVFQIETMNQHDIVSTADISGKILSVNDKFCDISGYSRDELIGENHRILKSGFHTKEFYNDLWETISNGSVWHGSICNRKKDGTEYWVESTIVPFLDINGLPYKYVSARTNITPIRESEERLNRSQSFANIGTWDWNIATGKLFWSDRIWTLFGYNHEAVENTYDNFLSAVHPDDRILVTNAVQSCLDGDKKYNIEHRVVWPDGSVHWVQDNGNVVRAEDGTALRMLGVVQDITLRKQVEIKLKETEESNRLLLESVGEGIYGVDLDGSTTFVNPVFVNMLGFTAEEIIGQPIHDLIHHTHADGTKYLISECPIHAALKDREVHKVNNDIFWRKDGTGLPVEYTTTPVIKNDIIVGAVTVFQDISQRIKAEQDILTAKENAENANQAKSQFLSSMSHELRTPMNAIMGFGQLLTMDVENPLDESQADNVNEIMKASKHLLKLINEVLDLAKIESGQINLSIEKVMLSDIVNESLQLIYPLAEKRNIKIIIKVDDREINFEEMLEQQYAVLADHIRLKQVLINILSNAVKYNKDNGSIIITCEYIDDKIKINIKDSGVGLTAEQQLKLFIPFERLGAEQSDVEGAGIGLVITKNIIEQMNGDIGVQSEYGKGSTFWIKLPACKALDENQKIDDALTNKNIKIFKENIECTVLYIEDNPANLKLVSMLLNRLPNVHMWSAHEPMLGLELAKEHVPDIILLNINLPGIDGYEVLKQLRSNDLTSTIPVIAISANAMNKDIKKGLQAGFEKYITKPININALLDSVDEVLKNVKKEK